jgi:hypothetical protein
VDAARFRKVVDELIADGTVVEIEEEALGSRRPRHFLVRADQVEAFEWSRLVRVDAREDLRTRIETSLGKQLSAGG